VPSGKHAAPAGKPAVVTIITRNLLAISAKVRYYCANGTSLKTGNFEWSAAGGWAQDSDRRSSPHLRLGVLTRR
jgi:hypothetical protein